MTPDLTTAARPALAGVAPRVAPAVRLETLPPCARFSLRTRDAARKAAAAPLGFALPTLACRAASHGARAALWLGPDEWLILAPLAEADALRDALTRAFGELPHALVDIGHRQSGLVLSGAQAAAVLNVGCPLDLDIAAFPLGMCTRTVLGKASITLWRTGATRFHIEAWRSFLPYVWAFLDESGREFLG